MVAKRVLSIIVAISIALSGVTLTSGEEQTQESATIKGYILDISTGLGIAYAYVQIYTDDWEYWNYTYANDTGYYEIDTMPGHLNIKGDAEGYYYNITDIEVSDGEILWYNISLNPANENSTLKGYITDNGTGEGIADAYININNHNWDDGTTSNETGYYELTTISGDLIASAGKEGYFKRELELSIEEGSVLWLNITLDKVPPMNSTVYGYVNDSKTGRPIENATVLLWDEEHEYAILNFTNTEGFYQLKSYAGEFVFGAMKEGYATYFEIVNIEENASYEKSVLLTPESSLVYGYITDFKTAKPLENAEVSLRDKSTLFRESDETDSNGYYEISIYEGEFYFNVNAENYYEYHDELTIEENESIEKNVSLIKTKAQNSLVIGHVYDGSTNESIKGAVVFITDEYDKHNVYKREIETDDTGYYQLTAYEGEFKFECYYEGYFIYEEEIVVGDNETKVIDVYLEPLPPLNSTIKGYVRDEFNNPLRPEFMLASDFIEGSRFLLENITDDGYYEFKVYAGRFLVAAFKGGYDSNLTRVEVDENATVWNNITLFSENSTVYGYIYDEHGLPIPNIIVTLHDPYRWFDDNQAITDEYGYYEIKVHGDEYIMIIQDEMEDPFDVGNYEPSIFEITVPKDENMSIDWVLKEPIPSIGMQVIEFSDWNNVSVESATRASINASRMLRIMVDAYIGNGDLYLSQEEQDDLVEILKEKDMIMETSEGQFSVDDIYYVLVNGTENLTFESAVGPWNSTENVTMRTYAEFVSNESIIESPVHFIGIYVKYDTPGEKSIIYLKPPERYELIGYDATENINITANDNITIDPLDDPDIEDEKISEWVELTISHEQNSSLQGYLYNEEGEPLENIEVMLYNFTYDYLNVTLSNATGYYQINTWSGGFILIVGGNEPEQWDGYQANLTYISISNDQKIEINITLSEAVENEVNLSIVLEDWSNATFYLSCLLNEDTNFLRFKIDIAFGNGDGELNGSEVDDWINAMVSGYDVPLGYDSKDLFYIDGFCFIMHNDTLNFVAENVEGNYTSSEPINAYFSAKYVSETSMPLKSNYTLELNATYDNETGLYIYHIEMPEYFGMKYYYEVENVTVTGTDNVTIDPLNDPDPDDDVFSEWMRLIVNDTSAPTIVDGSGNLSATTGETANVWVRADDNVDPVSAILFYKRVSETEWSSAEMMESDNRFNYTIEIDAINDENYLYYIIVYDGAMNNASYGSALSPYNIDVRDNDNPIVGLDETPNIAYTGDELEFRVRARDNIGVEKVTVEYWFGLGAHENETMALIGFETFTFTIIIPLNSTEKLHYRFTAFDRAGNWDRSILRSITIIDNDLPTIIDFSFIEEVEEDRELTLYANVTDNIQVKFAYINYTYLGIDYYREMSYVAENQYKVVIGPFDPDIVEYYIYAEDDEGNSRFSNVVFLNVIDITPPQIIEGSKYLNGTTGESVTVWVNVTDNVQISECKLYYNRSSGWETVTMFKGSGNHYYYNLSIQWNSTETIFYYIAVSDGINTAYYGKDTPFHINVSDNDAPEFGEDSTPEKGGTGDLFTFYIDVNDNINVSFVFIEYWYGSGAHENKTMEDEDTYTLSITIPSNSTDTLHYFFACNDTSNNWNYTDVKNVSIEDNDDPEIINISVIEFIDEDTNVTIYANVTDNIALMNVTLYYTYNNTNYSIKMEGTSVEQFRATIGPFEPGTVEYYINATDIHGNFAESERIIMSINDTTAPSPITFLFADAKDGKVTLVWDPNEAPDDFDHYNLYYDTKPFYDVTEMTPYATIYDKLSNTYTVTGLTNGVTYYFALTIVDMSGNENKNVKPVNATPTALLPELSVTLLLDKEKLREGEKLGIKAKVMNTGNADAVNVSVIFYIDGKEVHSESVELISALGGIEIVTYNWTAKEGNHSIMVKVEFSDGTVASEIKYVEASEREEEEDYMNYIIMGIIVLIIIIVVIAVLRKRKEQFGEPFEPEEEYKEEFPEERMFEEKEDEIKELEDIEQAKDKDD